MAKPSIAVSEAPSCDMAAASPWINRWFSAWQLMSREVLHLSDDPPPNFVFFDTLCVYTTLRVAAPMAPVVDGPALLGARLDWRTATHGDTLTLPDSSRHAVDLMSFASSDRNAGAYFVMSAPSYWAKKGIRDNLEMTPVFLHEFTHTRQLKGWAPTLGPIDSAWSPPGGLDDDVVQKTFQSDSVYVAAYIEERDLLYQSADAGTETEARELAAKALQMMKARHAKYFTGDKAVYATLDDMWLSMEGAAQWTAAAWLQHPKGAGMDRKAAVARMLGKRRWWSQDEGLAVFLVVDRLVPDWPTLVFRVPSAGVIELLEKAAAK